MGTKSIGLFGASLDPPTYEGGHFSIVKYFSKVFDEVWVLPVYKHMYTAKHNLAPFETRMKLAEATFKDLKNVKVKAYEKEAFEALQAAKSPDVSDSEIGTIDLVEYVKEKFPDDKFTWILGADTFNDIKKGKWKRGGDLLQMVSFALVKRQGHVLPTNVSDLGSAVKLFDIPLGEVSSSSARSCTDKVALAELVHPEVANVISEDQLYGFRQ